MKIDQVHINSSCTLPLSKEVLGAPPSPRERSLLFVLYIYIIANEFTDTLVMTV